MRECPDYAMTQVTSGGALDHKVLRGRTKKTKFPGIVGPQKSARSLVGSATRTAFPTAMKSMISCKIAPSSGGR
jgi:hypothetical protein